MTERSATSPPFKAFRSFNAEPPSIRANSRSRPGEWILEWFADDSLEHRLARALLSRRLIPYKELLEAFEFFERSRRRVRAACVVDLCCGHGLVGMLYGAFCRDVERVLCVDKAIPDSAEEMLAALTSEAPWLGPKVRLQSSAIDTIELPPASALVGVHACGSATDEIIHRAVTGRHKVALLPCCHAKATAAAPATLTQQLGVALATDIDRTYVLQRSGFRTRWTAIPDSITPQNRVILAWPSVPV